MNTQLAETTNKKKTTDLKPVFNYQSFTVKEVDKFEILKERFKQSIKANFSKPQ